MQNGKIYLLTIVELNWKMLKSSIEMDGLTTFPAPAVSDGSIITGNEDIS